MIRSIFAIVTGLTTTFVVAVGWGELVFPDAISEIETAADVPLKWLLMEEVGYVVGSFGAGVAVWLVFPRRAMGLALMVGGLWTLPFAFSIDDPSYPLWLDVLHVLTPVPCAALGAATAGARLRGERMRDN